MAKTISMARQLCKEWKWVSFAEEYPKHCYTTWGRGGVLLVTVLAFYSDNSSSNRVEAYSFLL